MGFRPAVFLYLHVSGTLEALRQLVHLEMVTVGTTESRVFMKKPFKGTEISTSSNVLESIL